MNNSKFYIPIMALLFALGHFFYATAQNDKELLAQLVAEDQDAINALVLYPEDTRLSILEATLHPEALIKLESIQSQTKTAFQELMDNYSRNTQEMIWDLTRYPGLIHRLAVLDPNSRSAVKNVLKDYPDIIHRRARAAVTDYHYLLVEIDQLNVAAGAAFDSLLSGYPESTQMALRELIELPEVLTLLTDNIRLTVLAGDVYRKDPAWVLQKADSFHLEVARRNAEEIENWKTSLENDPDALNELKASAENYEAEYGYDDEYYDYERDDLYYDGEVENVVVRHYYHYHYPYWFGYPTWYYYPRWRLYPTWYDWGFYFNPGGSCIVVNLPSFHFMHWYFYHPHHHYYWPHLSTHFTSHYYGHRPSGHNSSVTVTVNNWRKSNRGVITEEWLRDDGRLEDRFKEYGKFEAARTKYNREHPQKAQTQKEYLERNTRRYPKMTEKAGKVQKGDRTYREPTRKDTRRPEAVVPKKKDKTARKDSRKEVVIPQEKEKTTIKKQTPPSRTNPKINRGKDYHKNTWEKARKTRPKINTRPSPSVKSKPRIKTRTPKVTTRKTKRKN